MAQAILETAFDAVYLLTVITAGLVMLARGQSALVRKFGIMAVVLGGGDAFHLLPRVYALWTTGLEANAAALGIGKLITSLTMTVFYFLLYLVWRERYAVRGRRGLTVVMGALLAARVALCLLPQNEWLSYHPPLLFGILRNLPFAAMGALILALFATEAKKQADRAFANLWLAVLLSFAFYLPVVVWGDTVPALGMLMIPKTLAYVWIVSMGWKVYRAQRTEGGNPV